MPERVEDALIERFIGEAAAIVPLAAVWAHGSLAMGDFQPGRSDLDLVAVVDGGLDGGCVQRLASMHGSLMSEEPAAEKLHCSYMLRSELDDPGRPHFTWAQERVLHRPVTPVSRRELLDAGLVLRGRAPSELLPPVPRAELDAFIRRDLREFWLAAAERPRPWLADIWVDLGPLTLARATVTLREGRLITKREALDELGSLGASDELVDDIYQRRYGDAPPAGPLWRCRRARLARSFVYFGIARVLAER